MSAEPRAAVCFACASLAGVRLASCLAYVLRGMEINVEAVLMTTKQLRWMCTTPTTDA